MQQERQAKGFTIVELLIVVVVIAILAAITIVAYNGIQNRTYDSAVQTDLKQLATQIELYKVQQGRLPVSVSDLSTMGIKVTKSAYGVLWVDSGSGQSLNLLYCHPSNNANAYTLVARSRSGTAFRYGTSGVGEVASINSSGGSGTVCASAGLSIPTGGDANRTILYNPVDSVGWWPWIGG